MAAPPSYPNAIRLVACDHDQLCHGFRWEVVDEDALAQLIAWTMQGHYRHAQRVLTELNANATQWGTPITQAIARLTLPDDTDDGAQIRTQRDGLLFQHIAWVAALVHGGRNIAISMPHMVTAQKGFDALFIPLNTEGHAHQGIVICEEKATAYPRNLITSSVWPDFVNLENGLRDAEVLAELTSLLERADIPNIDQVLQEAYWLGRKSYRVSITTLPEQDTDDGRKALFEGYDSKINGDTNRRRAETISLPNVRRWMDAFAVQVIAKLAQAHV